MDLQDLKDIEDQIAKLKRDDGYLQTNIRTLADIRSSIAEGKVNDLQSFLTSASYNTNVRKAVGAEILELAPDICRMIEMRLQGKSRSITTTIRIKQKQIREFFNEQEPTTWG